MLLRTKGLQVILALLILEAVCGSEKFDRQKKVILTLTPNSQYQIQLPRTSDEHPSISISSFENPNTQAISSPCLLSKQRQSVFRKDGWIEHNWLLISEGSLFWRGNIWDIIEVENTIIAVFEDGEVTYFKTKSQAKGNDVEYFQKNEIVKLLDENVAYGRLFTCKEGIKTHIIYMSLNGCYLVQTDSWIKLTGYEGDRFSDAVIVDNKIITANRGKIKVYSLMVSDLAIELEIQASVYLLQQNEKIILTISSLYYDSSNDRIYLIDDYQGIKFISMPNSNKTMQIQAENLLYAEKCQDIVIADQLLFISCSSLIIVNSSNHNLLQQIQYPFHINRIYYSDGELVALGDHQLVVYLILKHLNQQLKVEFLFRGNLTGKVYQHYHYLHSSKHILLFSQQGLQYGKIVAPKSSLKCAYRYIAGPQQYQQMVGINKGQLSIYSRCKQSKTSLYYSQCLNKYQVQIKIHDIKEIKFIFWVLIGLLFLVLGITSSLRMRNLLKEKQTMEFVIRHQQQSVEVEDKIAEKTVQMQPPKE